MDFEQFLIDNKSLFLDNFVTGFGLGMSVWFFTWGLNRVYLMVKSNLTF